MWAWVRNYKNRARAVRRDSAEAHLEQLRRDVIQCRADLADLHEEVAFTLEDLDSLTRRIVRVQAQVKERTPEPADVKPAVLTLAHHQR